VGAGIALSYAGLALTMIAAGAGLVVLAGGLAAVMPERGFAPTPRGARTTWQHTRATVREGFAAVRASAVLIAFTGLLLFYFMGSESFDRLWEIHLLRVGLPAVRGMTPVAWFGAINAVGLLLSIAAAEVLRRRLGDAGEAALVRWLLALTIATALGMVAFGAATGFPAALAAFWGVTVARQVFPPIANAWVNRHIPSEVRATVLSFGAQADAAGQIAGGPLFGWIAGAHSTGLAMAAAGASLLPGLTLLLWARRSPRGRG
jgi:DHA3 family tetracycline resistance protein-like MFS transporter